MRQYPHRGLHGKAVEDMGRRIVSGEITVNQSIPFDDLVTRYAASRGAVREALRVLGAKRMVDAVPHRGTFVTPRQSWSLLDPDVLRWQFEMTPNIELLE